MKYFLPELKNVFAVCYDEDGSICAIYPRNTKEDLLQYIGSDIVEALEEETRQELTY